MLGEAFDERASEFSAAWKSLQKKVMRRRVIDEGVRLDGRGPKDIRRLSAEVGSSRGATARHCSSAARPRC
jgi:polyribonucleotide nucleotidyltransferase